MTDAVRAVLMRGCVWECQRCRRRYYRGERPFCPHCEPQAERCESVASWGARCELRVGHLGRHEMSGKTWEPPATEAATLRRFEAEPLITAFLEQVRRMVHTRNEQTVELVIHYGDVSTNGRVLRLVARFEENNDRR